MYDENSSWTPIVETEQLLADAHEQLLARDRELLRMGQELARLRRADNGRHPPSQGSTTDSTVSRAFGNELERMLEERTQWAQRSVQAVAERDEIIRQLQKSLAEQTEWAQLSVDAVAKRDNMIRELEETLSQQSARIEQVFRQLNT